MLPFLEHKDTDLFLYSYKNFSFPSHFHSGLELICAAEGSITLTVGGSDWEVPQNGLGVVLPGQIHSYRTPAETANSGGIILLGQRLLGEYDGEFSGKSLKKPVFRLKDLHPHCAVAIETLLRSGGESLRLQKAYARLFLCRFLPEADFAAGGGQDDPLLYSLVKYMSDHYRESISLGQAAEALYVNKYHLSRLFSGAMKMNFNDYLNSLRINAAVQLLDSTDLPVTKIAYEVGFGNVRTFNRAFLKQVGAPPRAYRNSRI